MRTKQIAYYLKKMDFVINEYHRNIPDEELLEDLKRVAAIYGKDSLTRGEYERHGKYHWSTIGRRFGTWNDALIQAHLSISRGGMAKHLYCENDNAFFRDVYDVAQRLGKDYITSGDYLKFGKYNVSSRTRRYRSWDTILQLSNLSSTPYRLGKNKKIDNKELFEDIERVWRKLGRQPTITDVKKGEFRFGQNTFCRRFGGWRRTIEAFIDYINSGEASNLFMQSDNQNKKIVEKEYISQQNILHKTPRDINLRLRFKVMSRDHFKCCKCGRSPATDPSVILHVDHIFPWAKGGETTMDNLETLCSDCNLGKSDTILKD